MQLIKILRVQGGTLSLFSSVPFEYKVMTMQVIMNATTVMAMQIMKNADNAGVDPDALGKESWRTFK